MLNENLFRWVTASVNTQFTNILTGKSIVLLSRGQEYSVDKTDSDIFELSVGGFKFTDITVSQSRLFCVVSLLCSIHYDPADIYKVQRLEGTIATCFANSICCYAYGAGDVDTQNYIGQLQAVTTNQDLEIDFFDLAPNIRVGQALLNRQYQMELFNEV